MRQETMLKDRPIQVVLIDHSYLHLIGWAEKFAKSLSGFRVVLVTDKSPSRKDDAFEIVNVRDVAQNLELEELQHRLNFPLNLALVAERAYFDYTTFTRHACYSRLSLRKIGELIRPHVNALDEIIRTRADLVIGYVADNAVAALAAHIADNYGKPYLAPFGYYWWSDGFIVYDRPNQTSSEVDELYRRYYANQDLIDRKSIQALYSTKRTRLEYPDIVVYPLGVRIKKILASRRWHDPFSPTNWLLRRAIYPVSQIMVACFTRTLKDVPSGERYVLFPMHVAPEASLLGSTPEFGDQFSLIKDISMNLPWGVRLCVKNHPGQNKWCGPAFDFYRKLGALPNVDVIAARVPVEKLLRDKNCIAVATINGTVGLEAAMVGKPVFLFGKVVFGIADCFLKPKSFDEFRDQMMMIYRGEYEFDEGAMWAILAALNSSVWRGDNAFALAETAEEARLRSFSVFERYIRSEIWRKPASIQSGARGTTF
jgi:hypothetical protein